MRFTDIFKVLKGPITIEKVRCQTTGFCIEGPFASPAIFQLGEEQLLIVELLAIHGGNLKKVAEDLGRKRSIFNFRKSIQTQVLRTYRISISIR